MSVKSLVADYLKNSYGNGSEYRNSQKEDRKKKPSLKRIDSISKNFQ